MTNEEWRPVVGYEGSYEVSNTGKVKSLNYNHTGKEGVLKANRHKNGYLFAALSKCGKIKIKSIHRLVWEAFKYIIPEGMEIDHINTVRDDNRLDNLRCVTRKENHANPLSKKRHAEAANKLFGDTRHKEKMVEAMRRLAQDPEWQKNHAEAMKKRAKPVDQFTLDGKYVKTWESATDAAREIGGSQANISACCRDKIKTVYGSIWRFATQV